MTSVYDYTARSLDGSEVALSADSDEAARANRNDAAQDSEMMSPGSLGCCRPGRGGLLADVF